MLLNLLIRKLLFLDTKEHQADQHCFEFNFEEALIRVGIKFQRQKTPALSRSLSFLDILGT
uniref:Uncharacterized protein n=1 Tax=Glossina palpalis gambiensis TaxID=67801 RepID=A0A1B0C0V5_9MUSC